MPGLGSVSCSKGPRPSRQPLQKERARLRRALFLGQDFPKQAACRPPQPGIRGFTMPPLWGIREFPMGQLPSQGGAHRRSRREGARPTPGRAPVWLRKTAALPQLKPRAKNTPEQGKLCSGVGWAYKYGWQVKRVLREKTFALIRERSSAAASRKRTCLQGRRQTEGGLFRGGRELPLPMARPTPGRIGSGVFETPILFIPPRKTKRGEPQGLTAACLKGQHFIQCGGNKKRENTT